MSRLVVPLLATLLAAPAPAASEPAEDCGLEDPGIAAAAPPVPRRATEGATKARRAALPPPVTRISARGEPLVGALSGKVVYLSPGHGFTYLPDVPGWRTQRGNTHDLVEDLISVETASFYLANMLRNMGATVVPVRELDVGTERVIVDDSDGGFSLDGGGEAGPAGFGHLAEPIAGGENPFAAGATTTFDAGGGAEATWSFDWDAPGRHAVYVAYAADPGRASAAHYVVRHAAGETHFRVDQRRHGGTWVYLGSFAFAGSGQVALLADSDEPGATLSADVVRVGGGMGNFDRGGGVSGRPMFEQAARYYTQWAGAPETVWNYTGVDRSSDVGCRSRFAAWHHEEGEDAVYVAWHTNAPDPGLGTSSFAYGPSSYGTLDEFSGVPGSLELMDAIHTQIVGDLRAAWDPGWTDRGEHTAYFGEVNPDHNPEMPATLVEVAFHDTAADAEALRDPRFRRIAARAFARGVARYFAERDGTELVLPPDTPVAVTARHRGGHLILSWQDAQPGPASGDPATGYRVYLSPDGVAFDAGREVEGTELDLDAEPAWKDAPVIYARVAAENAGGESLPSAVAGSRRAADGAAPVLVVGGFDRLDGGMLYPDDLSTYGLAQVDRGLIDRINDESYVDRYGAALADLGVSFDSAAAGAVASGAVDLSDYQAVLWYLGEESSEDDPLDAGERAALAAYLEGGGHLLVSGSELAWAMDNVAGGEAAAFFRDTFGAGYVADDAGTFAVTDGAGLFAGLDPLSFDDAGPGGYLAEYPDVLEALAGAEAVLFYDQVETGAAAVASHEGRVVLLGFPFETIAGAAQRTAVMQRILDAFGVEPEPALGDSGGCGCQSDPGAGAGGLALVLLSLATFRLRWPRRRKSIRRSPSPFRAK